MIEFCGVLSDKCIEYILKKEREVSLLSALIVSIILGILIIILAIVIDWIFIIALFVSVLITVLAGLPPSKKSYCKIIPKKIIIKDGIIESEGEGFHYTRNLSEVDYVLDMGEWYHIYFKYKYRNPRFICQKDLIKQGTLEEFEILFKNKLKK